MNGLLSASRTILLKKAKIARRNHAAALQSIFLDSLHHSLDHTLILLKLDESHCACRLANLEILLHRRHNLISVRHLFIVI